MPPSDFGISVNPISIKEGKLYPTHYYSTPTPGFPDLLTALLRIDPLVFGLVTFLDDVGDDSESRTSMFCFVVCAVVVVPFCLFVCCTSNARRNGLF